MWLKVSKAENLLKAGSKSSTSAGLSVPLAPALPPHQTWRLCQPHPPPRGLLGHRDEAGWGI